MAEDIEVADFEDCLLDFMDLKFSMSLEDNSAKEVILLLINKFRSEIPY